MISAFLPIFASRGDEIARSVASSWARDFTPALLSEVVPVET